MQKRFWRTGIDFSADAVNVYLDQIREWIKLFVPHMLGDFRSSHHAAGISCKKFDERILLGCKGNGAPAARNILANGVDDQIRHHDLRRPQAARAPKQRAKPRQQFPEFEWLCEVIISATIEPGDPVLHGVPRREHQNRHALPGFAQLATNSEAIRRRNHDIQYREVVSIDRSLVQGLLARTHYIQRVRVFAQAFRNEPCNSRIIFDQQETHRRIISLFSICKHARRRNNPVSEFSFCLSSTK